MVPPDSSLKTNDDLRLVSDSLLNISRTLHEHTHKLEVAVEGTYAGSGSDPRIRLLSETLHLSRIADLEMGRLNQAMMRIMQAFQAQNRQNATNVMSLPSTPIPPPSESFDRDREREALTTISNLKRERNELETLYDIARTLNSTLEFDRVLRLVMEQVISFVNAERGFLMLINPTTHNFFYCTA